MLLAVTGPHPATGSDPCHQVHDVGHDGFTNSFHKHRVTLRALTYNDQSIQVPPGASTARHHRPPGVAEARSPAPSACRPSENWRLALRSTSGQSTNTDRLKMKGEEQALRSPQQRTASTLLLIQLVLYVLDNVCGK